MLGKSYKWDELQNKHNLREFFRLKKEGSDNQAYIDLIENMEASPDSQGYATLFGFDPTVVYGESIYDLWAKAFSEVRTHKLSKDIFARYGAVGRPSKELYQYVIMDEIEREPKIAKPKPDWEHPIPVSVKHDGPSKQKRAMLRSKRKK